MHPMAAWPGMHRRVLRQRPDWELSACRPDLVLADYSELKKRDKMNPNELFFYKRVE